MRAMTGTGPAKTERGHRQARKPFVAAVVLVTAAIASVLLGATGAGAADNPGARGALTGTGGVSVGHSGWFWGDPQPQGNSLARDRLRRIPRVRGRGLRHAASDRRRRRDLGGAADGDHRSARHRARDRFQHGGDRGRLRAAPLRRRREDLHPPAMDGKRSELSQSDCLVCLSESLGRLPDDGGREHPAHGRRRDRRSPRRRRSREAARPAARALRPTSSSPAPRPVW